ncbi:MAG: hypothetical protein HRU32_14365 [Rhodobacteraceae bacterium]|nr:hypothetical protein [Paracoccaceae bacterium]
MPTSGDARPKRRHRIILASFLLMVILPVFATAYYLYQWADDQYASTVGFSVRKEEVASPIELLGGVSELAGSTSIDAAILYEFLHSQEIVQILDDRISLRDLYSKPEDDPVFAFDPSGTIEDLRDHWHRMVKVAYDDASGLIEVRALAFTPEDATLIATELFNESARLVNELSSIAQDDTIRFSKTELDLAIERLISARQAMTTFRSRTQIVDPTTDVQGQMGLLNTLQTQLAEALIELDLLRENTVAGDIRIRQLEARIEVIERRLAEERRKLGLGGVQIIEDGEDTDDSYALIFAEFERLAVDREFAETAYTAALASYDTALAEARRQSMYLAAHVKPTQAERAEFPARTELIALVTLFCFTGWGIMLMIYYSIRDRR